MIFMPFEGEPPAVKPGDKVMCRTAFGNWIERTALSEPRYDRPNALRGRCYLTVSVAVDAGPPVNWPAEDVRPIEPCGCTPTQECDRHFVQDDAAFERKADV